MLTTKPIRKRFHGDICRRCINDEYKVSLMHSDCKYGRTARCPRCGDQRHIVEGFVISGKKKMLYAI